MTIKIFTLFTLLWARYKRFIFLHNFMQLAMKRQVYTHLFNLKACKLSQVYFTKSQCAVGNSDNTNVQSSKSTVPLATT